MAATRALGHVQAWLAHGYREGTPLEQALIFPSWLVSQALFVCLFAVCQALV